MKPAVIALLSLALLVGSAGAAGKPNAADLEAELVCPTCKTTLDQSSAPIARRMKTIIRQRIAEGATADEIEAELVDQFGRGVLAEPPTKGLDLVAWLLPLAGIAVGIVGVAALAWGWARRGRRDPRDPPLDPELDRRVDEELARFEV